jgi:hypothetical protein
MSTAQHRMLSTFDTEKGRMHMAFLQVQVPDPKVITDYKRAIFKFQTKDVHPVDQMDLHKKTGEMVFYTLAHASTTASKLQVSLNNVQTQLMWRRYRPLPRTTGSRLWRNWSLRSGMIPRT